MSNTKRHINLIEVGPRDGLQSEPEILDTEVKLEFIRRAIDAGIKRMEVTFIRSGFRKWLMPKH